MMRLIVVGVLAVLLLPVSWPALTQTRPLAARDAAQVRAFRALHACPATMKTAGPCPGFVVDHQIPLCAGGPDTPANMIWQAKGASLIKDRIEWALCRRLRSCALS